jgi:DNA-directed RNA polymerase specialized sigma24 family protein
VTDGESLGALFGRVRAGDQHAATELVRRYEPALRRLVRLRLRDRQLRRLLDSADVGQAVLLHFLVRVASGEYECYTPEQVLKLLATMARRHLVNLALREQAAKRDYRRLATVPVEECAVAARGSSPSQHVAAQELLNKARLLLTPDERRLLELAYVCHLTRRHAAASRFATDAFRAEPKGADDLRAGHRYNAACYAALAGAGKGDDAPKDDNDRAALRAQALGWLRADVAAWTKVLDGGNPQACATVQATMRHWQGDPDLVSIRHPWSLLRLPADERRPWQKLWADVDELLKKASKAGM